MNDCEHLRDIEHALPAESWQQMRPQRIARGVYHDTVKSAKKTVIG
jgi:hypothetical protein